MADVKYSMSGHDYRMLKILLDYFSGVANREITTSALKTMVDYDLSLQADFDYFVKETLKRISQVIG